MLSSDGVKVVNQVKILVIEMTEELTFLTKNALKRVSAARVGFELFPLGWQTPVFLQISSTIIYHPGRCVLIFFFFKHKRFLFLFCPDLSLCLTICQIKRECIMCQVLSYLYWMCRLLCSLWLPGVRHCTWWPGSTRWITSVACSQGVFAGTPSVFVLYIGMVILSFYTELSDTSIV